MQNGEPECTSSVCKSAGQLERRWWAIFPCIHLPRKLGVDPSLHCAGVGLAKGPRRGLGGSRRCLQYPGVPGKEQDHPWNTVRDTQSSPSWGPGKG